MNVRLLRKIARLIQAKPREFDMRSYTNETECGTTHCIGGWAEKLTGKYANEALDLSSEEGNRLFYVTNGWGELLWPKRFVGRKKKGMTTDKSWWLPTPRQAAARIEHFIATGGRE